MLSDSPDESLEAFELCLSVWSLVLSHCPSKEVEEVQRVLGVSLIEQAADLREEVSTLLEIWRQYRDEQTTSTPLVQHGHLAEPPELRQRLVQEIIFFVEHLKKQSKQSLIKQDENRDILSYVESESVRSGRCDSSDSGSSVSVGIRPLSSVSSQDGRETPLRPLTPASQSGSQVSVLAERSECVNALDIDLAITHLRQALKDECAQHQRDVDFLQNCLEGEQTSAQHTQPPTIKELRTFGTQLERAILEESQLPSHSPAKPTKPKLPPLLSLQPRPPSSPNCTSQPLARASQVRKKQS